MPPAPGPAFAVDIAEAVRHGRISAVEVVRRCLAHIDALEPALQAWAALDPAVALSQAARVDRRRDGGAALGPLAGVPLGVKDILDTADLPTAYGSPIYRGARPARDAEAVAVARAADAVVLGKTVTTEFAYFTPGPTANPCNTAHTPGGSSSGSAAAVASGMVPLAFGTQTAGSLIRPASFCGIFALKPTHGSVSLQGVKPFAASLDTLGWLARSAEDLELMRSAMARQPYAPLAPPALADLALAVAVGPDSVHLDAGGRAAYADGLDRLRLAHGPLAEAPLSASLAALTEAQKTVMAYEAARHLRPELQDHRSQLSPALADLLDAGGQLTEAAYRGALALAAEGRRAIATLMQGLDALVVPAAPGEAPAGLAATGDPVFSRGWTLLGLPCVCVPGLRGPTGLPIGLQLVGHPHGERRLLAVAAAVHVALA